MSDEDDVIVACAAYIIIATKKRKIAPKKRRFWVRPSLQSKTRYNASDLIEDLKKDDVNILSLEYRCNGGFRNFFRMSESEFEYLLQKIGPKISKDDTNCRPAIPTTERLAITLRFLSTGDSYHSLMYLFKISKQAISKIIVEVCHALIEVLQDYIKMPKNEAEWKAVAHDYYNRWNFPNCVGAMDGKHISLQAPINSGSEFFNYKGFFSIVLFAVVDANYNFIYANVGCQGRISDGGVFSSTTFNKLLQDNTMHLPEENQLPNSDQISPYVFVADDAFPLSTNIMKPYAGTHPKGSSERVFNYRLSRARRISENVFGLISNVFRIFRKPLLLAPQTACKVTLAGCYLHNFLRKSASKNIYNPPGTFDSDCSDSRDVIPGAWRNDIGTPPGLADLPRIPRKSAVHAQQVRNTLRDYFMTPEGEVPWQYEIC